MRSASDEGALLSRLVSYIEIILSEVHGILDSASSSRLTYVYSSNETFEKWGGIMRRSFLDDFSRKERLLGFLSDFSGRFFVKRA